MELIQTSTQHGLLRPFRKAGLLLASHWRWPVSVKLTTGGRMYVDLRSSIGRALFMKGEFDPAVFIPLREALTAGGTFLDVGANVGYYSMLALDLVGPTGNVHAFEIDPRPLRSLRRTKAAGNLNNLSLHTVAVGNRDGTARFVTRDDSGHSSLSRSAEGREVPMITLDSWRASSGVRNIQAIKIDIEGAELWALQGAQVLLREERPLLVCEVFEGLEARSGYDRDDLLNFLRQLNYDVEDLGGVFSPTIVARPRK